jgi:hypothetical protein
MCCFMPKEKTKTNRSFTVDKDIDKQMDQYKTVNWSGVVNEYLRRYITNLPPINQ